MPEYFSGYLSFFSIRYFIILLGSFGVMFATQSRAILSIVILPLSNQYGWSETTQGLMLGSFSFGYFFTQLPSLWLERKIGCKKTMLIAVSLSGLFIFIFPFVVPNVPLCVLCYICVGLAQGPLWVVAYNLIVDWLLENERQVGLSTFSLMSLLGTATGLGLSPIIFRYLGWQSVYWLLGGAQIIWGILWMSFALDRPNAALYSLKKTRDERENRLREENGSTKLGAGKPQRLDATEFDGVEMEQEIHLLSSHDIHDLTSEDQCERKNFSDVPWRKVLAHHCIWIILTCQFANNYSSQIFNSWIPTFLKRTLGFDLRETGFISVLPYILQAIVGQVTAMSSKRALASGFISKKWLRRFFQTLGTALPALLLCVMSFVPNLSANQVLILLVLGMSVNGFVAGGYQMSYMDSFSPAYSTFVFSLGNVMSTLNGSISVYLVGYILDVSHFNWSIVWMIAVALWMTTLIPYLLFYTSEQYTFEVPTEEEEKLLQRSG